MIENEDMTNENFFKRLEVRYEICALSYFIHMEHVSYYIHQYVIIQLVMCFIDNYTLRCGITWLQTYSMEKCFGVYSTFEVFTLCAYTILANFIKLLVSIYKIALCIISTIYSFIDVFQWYIKAIYYNRRIKGMLSFTLKSMADVDYILETPFIICKLSSLCSSIINILINFSNRLEDKMRKYNFEGYGRYISKMKF